MERKSFLAARDPGSRLSCCQLRKDRSRPTLGANAMYFYTTRLLVFLAVTGGLATAIVLLLSGELIAHVFA